jgi:hypothetical protein
MHVRVADVLSETPLNVRFIRDLRDVRWQQWLHLVERLMNIQISNEPDSFTWHLTPSGFFIVKSLYVEYMNEDTRYLQ